VEQTYCEGMSHPTAHGFYRCICANSVYIGQIRSAYGFLAVHVCCETMHYCGLFTARWTSILWRSRPAPLLVPLASHTILQKAAGPTPFTQWPIFPSVSYLPADIFANPLPLSPKWNMHPSAHSITSTHHQVSCVRIRLQDRSQISGKLIADTFSTGPDRHKS
jgi:hypothetical protein